MPIKPTGDEAQTLVFVGGGHAHALVLRQWGDHPLSGVNLVLVDPSATPSYSGMLPGYVAGHYGRNDLDIDLVRLAHHAGARFVQAAATRIDPTGRQVHIEGGEPIDFDCLSIDIGAHSRLSAPIPGMDQIVPVKPLAAFAEAWDRFLHTARTTDAHRSIVIIGGGIGGVELALAMKHRLVTEGRAGASVSIVDRSAVPFAALSRQQSNALTKALAGAGVTCRFGTLIETVEPGRVRTSTGDTLPADFTVSATGARGYRWLEDSGLSMQDGFLTVDEALRCQPHGHIFAAGDCAHMAASPREKAGVFAVRQAPILFHNLRAALGHGTPRPFKPQKDYLKLVSVGRRSAIAMKYGHAVQAPWLWHWKDRIDRQFMARLNRSKP